MSFEDIEEAQVKRTEEENATTVKGKRGHKCNSPAPEVGY